RVRPPLPEPLSQFLPPPRPLRRQRTQGTSSARTERWDGRRRSGLEAEKRSSRAERKPCQYSGAAFRRALYGKSGSDLLCALLHGRDTYTRRVVRGQPGPIVADLNREFTALDGQDDLATLGSGMPD